MKFPPKRSPRQRSAPAANTHRKAERTGEGCTALCSSCSPGYCVCTARELRDTQPLCDFTHSTGRKTWSSVCESKTSPSTTTACKGSYPTARGCSGEGRKASSRHSKALKSTSDSVPCSTMESLTAASDPRLAFLFNDKVIWELKARGKTMSHPSKQLVVT